MKMKRYLTVLALAAMLLPGCKDPEVPQPEPDPQNQEDTLKATLVAPSNLRVEVPDGKSATLRWTNESTDYDGVEVQKAGPNGKYRIMGNVPKGILFFDDLNFTENGEYSYRVCSYKANTYSDYASVSFTIDGVPDPDPQISIDAVKTAPGMVMVTYTVSDDCGDQVETGVVWSASSTVPAELGKDKSLAYGKKLHTFGKGIGFMFDVSDQFNFRVYAKTSDGRVGYSDIQTPTIEPAPEPYNVSYTDVTPSDVPSEIKVYKASTSVTGRPTNIWYSIADLSTGNVVLRTLCPPTNAKTSEYAKANVAVPYVFTNGGYFGGSSSVSYCLDQGQKKAENQSSLSRKKTYYVARGVFGATSSGEASVTWRFGGTLNGGPHFYDTPFPQVDGWPVLSPSATFPDEAVDPQYYSAVGGGPVLVKDGKTIINFLMEDDVYMANFELFPDDIFHKTTRQPRTAIGRTADGKVVLMVVDGRNSGVSEGVVLTDLARLMRGVGCVDVMNLDGGGSSVFCAGQDLTILNRPSSSGAERAVLTMVGFAKP